MSGTFSSTNAQTFNVRDFGAQGNYFADDTAAFQAAINAAHAASLTVGGRRIVEIPGGDYRVGGLELPGGVVLKGHAPSVTRLFSRDEGQSTIELSAPQQTVASVQIENIGFFADGRGGTAVSLQGTDADSRIVDVRIADCQFSQFDTAVSLRLCASVWLERLHASTCETGFRIDTCADVRVNQCFADNGAGWGFHVSADSQYGAAGEGISLMGCTTNGQGGGLLVENHFWGEAIGCSFTTTTGPAMFVDAYGWRILAAELGTAASGAPGLVLGPNSANNVVTGSYFALNSTAIIVDGKGHLIGDNIIEAGLDAGSDIVIAGVDNVIRGNQVRSTAAVSIRETASADGNLIDGNLVHGTIAKAGAASVITLTNYNSAPGSGLLTPIQQPPLITAPGYTPQAAGQAIPATALFTATDPNGDALHFSVRDDTPAAGSGYWVLAGEVQPAGKVLAVSAADLATLAFVAGADGDDLAVRVWDGTSPPTDWIAFRVNPADPQAAPPPAAPPAPGPDPATPPAQPPLWMTDTTTNQTTTPALAPYVGPLPYLEGEFVYIGSNDLALVATAPNVFLRTGSGNDALAVTAGRNVLDAGAGSNFLTGGAGQDTFFLDARGATEIVWSTVVGFGAGDAATVWGVSLDDFAISWIDNQGAAGFTGLTMHAQSPGKADILLTLAGVTDADRTSGRLSIIHGNDSASGSDFLHVVF